MDDATNLCGIAHCYVDNNCAMSRIKQIRNRLLFKLLNYTSKALNIPIQYDAERAIFKIHGINYSEYLFKSWAKEGIPVGTKFVLANRSLDDGQMMIAIERC